MIGKYLMVAASASLVAGLVAAVKHAPAPQPLPFYQDATLTPHFSNDARASSETHTVGDFQLIDQKGRATSRADVAGRVYVASFFYTQCRTLCPDLRTQLARVHETFASDTNVLILSHSVTPEADNVGKLEHYAHVNHIDHTQWRLLTGARAEIERLARERYFVELSDTTGNTKGRLTHTETLVLVDQAGHIRGVYDGSLAFEVSQLIKDINTLRNEHA